MTHKITFWYISFLLILIPFELQAKKLVDESHFKIGIWYECQTDENMTIKIFRPNTEKVLGPDFTLYRIKDEGFPMYRGVNGFEEIVIISFYSDGTIIFGTSTIEPYEVKCKALGKRALIQK